MKTIEQLLNEAIQVQDACNLSGVVHSFSRAISELRENGINDTAAINSHAVSVLYASKIASLTEQNNTAIEFAAFNAGMNASKS